MAQLYTCFSPEGEKFELTRPNFLDCTQHYGFTTSRPNAVEVVEDDDAPVEDVVEDEAVVGDDEDAPVADDDAEDAIVEEASEIEFEDKDDVKRYLRSQGIDFDGRASFADLVAVAKAGVASA
jgi:hypothetical protein